MTANQSELNTLANVIGRTTVTEIIGGIPLNRPEQLGPDEDRAVDTAYKIVELFRRNHVEPQTISEWFNDAVPSDDHERGDLAVRSWAQAISDGEGAPAKKSARQFIKELRHDDVDVAEHDKVHSINWVHLRTAVRS